MKPDIRICGDFGGATVLGLCEISAEPMLPESRICGLPKSSSHFLGTWRASDGTTFRLLRSVAPYSTPPERRHFFTSRGGGMLVPGPEREQLYAGPVRTTSSGGTVRFAGSDQRLAPFSYEWNPKGVHWIEGEVAEMRGEALCAATQWLNPWREGGAYVVCSNYRMRGHILGQPMEGFAIHEIHYFPEGRTFYDSPFGWGGREISWGHMVTEFEDGTTVVANLAVGADGWGFAFLLDETGTWHVTTEITAQVGLRANKSAERIHYSFLGQEWIWQAAPDGERAPTREGGHPGGEGILTRKGEKRKVARALGTIDWWIDGRAAGLVRA